MYLLISEFRIYASLTLRFAYKRVFVYMQLGYMQTILLVPSTCIYPSSTVLLGGVQQLPRMYVTIMTELLSNVSALTLVCRVRGNIRHLLVG